MTVEEEIIFIKERLSQLDLEEKLLNQSLFYQPIQDPFYSILSIIYELDFMKS